LQQYDYQIAYRKGQLNVVADALSRQPLPETLRGSKETSAAEASSTGYTPSFITQGREPSALNDRETLGTGRLAEKEQANRIREIFEIVRRNLERASHDQARHYNLRRRQWTPAVGDVVVTPRILK